MRFLNGKKHKKTINETIILEISEDHTILNEKEIDTNFLYKLLKKQKLQELQNIDYMIKNKEMELLIANKKQKNDKKELNECTICLDKPKDMVNVPCGHCFCSDCIKESSHCYICREKILHKQKIFI